MNKFIIATSVILLISCAGQQRILFKPEPGYNDIIQNNPVSIADITETKAGPGNSNIPGWLSAYIKGGIDEVEDINLYMNKYCFIGVSEGSNFSALSKWADNYSVIHDFPRMAAVRVERRLISAATLYPDDEYGNFFEVMVKKAFDTEFSNAFLEDTFWIKKRVTQDAPDDSINENADVYEFYVFISVSKTEMITVIEKMMAETLATVTVTRSQNNAIRRLQNNFFLEF